MGTNEIVPGSIVQIYLAYTNSGAGAASNLSVECEIDPNLAPYVPGSAAIPCGHACFATNGQFEGYTPLGKVDPRVLRIRFQVPYVAANSCGVMEYRVCVR